MLIPFHKPIIPRDFNIITPSSLKEGWLTTGNEAKKFEENISSFTNSKYVVAVNSCTAGLHLSMAAKSFSSSDKFIVPTYTFVASVEIGEYCGMQPVLVDCDENYNLDLNQVEDFIKKDSKIKAIVPVHFAGRPVNMVKIYDIAQKYGLFVLEDAAHAFETISNYGKVGDTRYAAAFSFYANKNITTAGEGGAVATNNQNLADKIRKLSLHGMSKDGWKRFKIGNKWQYDISCLGFKYNLTDFAAAFGNWQLKFINEWHEKRSKIFKSYIDGLNGINGLVLPSLVNGMEKHGYHLFIIRIVPSAWGINRDEIIELLNDLGIGTSVHYIPVHMHSYYQKVWLLALVIFQMLVNFLKL